MTQGTTTVQVLTIGIDLGDRYSHYCVLGQDGEVLEEGRLSTKPEGFQQRFGSMVGCRIALEVGTHSAWVNQLLQEAGHEVVVANPRKLRMIYQADSKHDRLDAEQLARVARMDPRLLSPMHRAPENGSIKSANGSTAGDGVCPSVTNRECRATLLTSCSHGWPSHGKRFKLAFPTRLATSNARDFGVSGSGGA